MRFRTILHALIVGGSLCGYAVSVCRQPTAPAASAGHRSLAVAGRPALRPSATAPAALLFDAHRALRTVEELCALGPRPGGSCGEQAAARYLRTHLRGYGYEVTTGPTVGLTGAEGATHVLWAGLPSNQGRETIVVGAHYDSARRAGVVGANDNASGVAVTLELARVLAGEALPHSLQFVFFGAEETSPSHPGLVGSRWFVDRGLPSGPSAMICVDMVGRGESLHAWYGGNRPDSLVRLLQGPARDLQIGLSIGQGPSNSDHAPFERAGVPALWLQRLPDPDNHRASDVPANVSLDALAQAGKLLERTLLGAPSD